MTFCYVFSQLASQCHLRKGGRTCYGYAIVWRRAVRSSSRREASEEASAKPAHSAGLLLRARRDFHLGLATSQHFNFIHPLPTPLKKQSKPRSYVELKKVINGLKAPDSQTRPRSRQNLLPTSPAATPLIQVHTRYIARCETARVQASEDNKKSVRREAQGSEIFGLSGLREIGVSIGPIPQPCLRPSVGCILPTCPTPSSI